MIPSLVRFFAFKRCERVHEVRKARKRAIQLVRYQSTRSQLSKAGKHTKKSQQKLLERTDLDTTVFGQGIKTVKIHQRLHI
jgi:hypothetical protein